MIYNAHAIQSWESGRLCAYEVILTLHGKLGTLMR